MKTIFLFSILFLSILNLQAQDKQQAEPAAMSKEQFDYLSLWEYQYIPSTDPSSTKVGELILRRKEYVVAPNQRDSLLPQIHFTIFPRNTADSMDAVQEDYSIKFGVCYPIAGTTLLKTKNFVFWSVSCTAAFSCSGMDYTRGNASRIIGMVSQKNYTSMEELLKDMPINKR